jgi:hypothetical protein
MSRANAHLTTNLSSLILDPFVRAAFEAAERDGLAPLPSWSTHHHRSMVVPLPFASAKPNWLDSPSRSGASLTRFFCPAGP